MTYTTVDEWYQHLKTATDTLKRSVELCEKELLEVLHAEKLKNPRATRRQMAALIFHQVDKKYDEVVLAMDECHRHIQHIDD